MPEQESTFPRTIHLVISLLVGISACSVAAFMFATDFIASPVFVLGISWALVVTSLDVGASLALFIRSSLGAGLGAAFGLAATTLSKVMTGSVQYHLATGVAFPLSMILALGDDNVNSPLTKVVRSDIGFQALYLVASFSRGEPAKAAWQVTATVSIGSGIACAVSLVFRSFFRYWGSQARFARTMQTFCLETSSLFEGVTSFLMQGPDHQAEMLRRYFVLDAQLDRVLLASATLDNSLWWVSPVRGLKRELVDCVSLVPVQLLAVIRTMHALYPAVIYEKLWTPMEPHFAHLSSSVAKILRPSVAAPQAPLEAHTPLAGTTPLGHTTEARTIGELCDTLYTSLTKNFVDTPSPELLRFVFALLAVMRFSRLAQHMVHLRGQWLTSKPYWSLRPLLGKVTRVVIELFNKQAWKKVLKQEGRYSIKIAVCHQILVQPLIAWHEAAPEGIARNAFWAVLPLLYCMLPTVGGAWVKGFRRFIGTVIGDGLGLVSVVVTGTGEVLGYLAQLFIVTYTSRLFVNIKVLGYASFVVGLTWIVTALANWTQPVSDKQHVQYAVDRIILTALGSGVCALLGAVVLPKYAGVIYREASAQVVLTGSDLFERGYEWVLGTNRSVLNPEMTVSAAELVYSYNVAAGFEATSRLRKEAGSRISLKEETEGEMWVLKFLRNTRGETVTTEKLVKELTNEIDHLKHSAAVLFATAAGTLVHEDVYRLVQAELGPGVEAVMKEILAQRDTLAHCLKSYGTVDIQSLGPLTSTVELDESFARLRDRLSGTQELLSALEGGLLRIYAYLYTIAEFAEAWSDLVNKIVPSTALFRHITAADLAPGRRRSSTYLSQ